MMERNLILFARTNKHRITFFTGTSLLFRQSFNFFIFCNKGKSGFSTRQRVCKTIGNFLRENDEIILFFFFDEFLNR